MPRKYTILMTVSGSH